MSKTIILARVSTKRQETEGLSLEEIQLPRARDYARDNNLNVIKEFKFSETGSEYKTRDKFNEMIEYVKKNKITDIVSFRVDRMTRNFRDSVLIDELRKKHDVKLHFIDDRLVLSRDSRSSDIIQWDFKVMFAKSQLERIKEDGMNSKMSKLERGELPWTAPYGYKNVTLDARNHTVQPDPLTSEIVKRMFVLYATGSYSVKTIVEAIRKETGIKISHSVGATILRNKFYIGIIVDRKGGGKEYIHGYERIISRDLFEMVQDVLDGNAKNKRRFFGIPFIYRGLITCAECGGAITNEYREKPSGRNYKLYHCTNFKKKHAKTTYINEEEITEQLVEVFKAFKTIPIEEIERLEKELKEIHQAENEFQDNTRKKLLEDRNRIVNQKRVAFDAMTTQSITLDDYTENKQRYDVEINRLDQQLTNLEEADKSFYATATYLLQLFKYGDKIFEVATVEEKRDILNIILSNYFLDGKKLSFTPNEPFATVLKLSERPVWQGHVESNHDLGFWRPIY